MGLLFGSRAVRRQCEAVREALGVPEHDVARIMSRARARTTGPNEVLIAQGEIADEMYIIVRGKFEVAVVGEDGRAKPLRVLGSGTCVGEMGLLEGTPRRATVTCRTDEGEVLALSATDVRYLLDGAGDARRSLRGKVDERQEQLARVRS